MIAMPSGDPFPIRDPPRLVAYTVGHPLYLPRFILRTVILVALVDRWAPGGCVAVVLLP